jgi:hypothetical protein
MAVDKKRTVAPLKPNTVPSAQPKPGSAVFDISHKTSLSLAMRSGWAGLAPFQERFICNSSPFLFESPRENLHIGVRNHEHWHSI